MNKLLSLKEWLTLEEASAHLSSVFQESVSTADLYRFALGGHLVLSVNFVNHGRARIGRKMPIREAGFRVMPALTQDEKGVRLSISADALPEFEAWLKAEPANEALLTASEPECKFVMLNGNQVSATECIKFDKQVVSIDGIWDLPMIGAERLDIENALQGEIGGPTVTLIHLDGAYVANPDGVFAWLQEHTSQNEYSSPESKSRPWNDPAAYDPAGGLPEDSVVVVRTVHLLQFIANTTNESPASPKPLDERERTTLLCIIGALARQQKLDISQPMKAGDAIAAMAPELDLSGRTIGEKLKVVDDAMERRTR